MVVLANRRISAESRDRLAYFSPIRVVLSRGWQVVITARGVFLASDSCKNEEAMSFPIRAVSHRRYVCQIGALSKLTL